MGGVEFMLDFGIVALVAGLAGYVCRRLQVSVVLGFLLAGVIIGPYTPPFQLVRDAEGVRVLADLGLVFLIFGIGLGFSIQRIRRLGAQVVLATALGALLVLFGCRIASSLLGLSDSQGLFVAAVLMVSSSAIIAKVLEETDSYHSSWGQLGLGVTLLEDIVAVVMLTLLSSMSAIGEGADSSPWEVLSMLLGFVALFSFSLLMLVPMTLRRLKVHATPELKMLLVTGVLLVFGWIAVKLGYSMALTAFIFGAIVGSTPQRPEVDRLFEGMRHLFGAVFFVSMGMLFNVGLVAEFWPMIAGLAGAAFLLRIPSTATALVITGNNLRDSLRASFSLTPLGEFSFVIAFLGVQTAVMPESFYPAAVGASFLTCLLAPALMRRTERLSTVVEDMIPAHVRRAIDAYHRWLERLRAGREKSIAWKLMAPRVLQTGLQLLLVVGCLALTSPILHLVERHLGPDILFSHGTRVIFALLTGLLVLAPAAAAWRNIGALAMIAAEATAGMSGPPMARALIRRAFASAAVAFAALWLGVLVPTGVLPLPIMLGVAVSLLLVAILFWNKLIFWHSRVEVRLREEVVTASEQPGEGSNLRRLPKLTKSLEDHLAIRELELPGNSAHAGRTIAETELRRQSGCSIVGIERSGFVISNPSPRRHLYPGDRLLLLGEPEALERGERLLRERRADLTRDDELDDLGTESVRVPAGSRLSGRMLRDLDLVNRHNVQVVAIRRGEQEVITPGADSTVEDGDELLLLGTHLSVRDFVDSLLPEQQGAE